MEVTWCGSEKYDAGNYAFIGWLRNFTNDYTKADVEELCSYSVKRICLNSENKFESVEIGEILMPPAF